VLSEELLLKLTGADTKNGKENTPDDFAK
jgi:hypothetical protein